MQTRLYTQMYQDASTPHMHTYNGLALAKNDVVLVVESLQQSSHCFHVEHALANVEASSARVFTNDKMVGLVLCV